MPMAITDGDLTVHNIRDLANLDSLFLTFVYMLVSRKQLYAMRIYVQLIFTRGQRRHEKMQTLVCVNNLTGVRRRFTGGWPRNYCIMQILHTNKATKIRELYRNYQTMLVYRVENVCQSNILPAILAGI